MKINLTISDESGWQKPINFEPNDKTFEANMLFMIKAIAGIQENYRVESITMNCKITREQEEK